MANRKKQTEVVNDGHMPRKQGPCKKSGTGLHVPTVASRDIRQVLDEHREYWPRLARGVHYDEDIYCARCGKRTFRTGWVRTDDIAAVMASGSTPTLPNQLDKINDKHRTSQ